jgi:hypothetical protein
VTSGKSESPIVGVACRQGVDHKGGICLCGPPVINKSVNGSMKTFKIDTRTDKEYEVIR